MIYNKKLGLLKTFPYICSINKKINMEGYTNNQIKALKALQNLKRKGFISTYIYKKEVSYIRSLNQSKKAVLS
jgi:hypothetical protein